MYELSIRRKFIAQHYLIGGDWGPENDLHSHNYLLDVRISGPELNKHGYLLDIVDLSDHLGTLVNKFQDQTLNELPEFSGLNPSIEHFSRILCEALSNHIVDSQANSITVRLWEDEIGWAAYTSTF